MYSTNARNLSFSLKVTEFAVWNSKIVPQYTGFKPTLCAVARSTWEVASTSANDSRTPGAGVQVRCCHRPHQARHSALLSGIASKYDSFSSSSTSSFISSLLTRRNVCDAEFTRRSSPLVVMASAVTRARLRTLTPRKGSPLKVYISRRDILQVFTLLVASGPQTCALKEEIRGTAKASPSRIDETGHDTPSQHGTGVRLPSLSPNLSKVVPQKDPWNRNQHTYKTVHTAPGTLFTGVNDVSVSSGGAGQLCFTWHGSACCELFSKQEMAQGPGALTRRASQSFVYRELTVRMIIVSVIDGEK